MVTLATKDRLDLFHFRVPILIEKIQMLMRYPKVESKMDAIKGPFSYVVRTLQHWL